MNRLKTASSQTRLRPKIALSLTPKKPTPPKSKDRTPRLSPRASRPANQNKRQPEAPKDHSKEPGRRGLRIETQVGLSLVDHNREAKGYETPKFKGEGEGGGRQLAQHNFFSFGEQEGGESVRQRLERNKENIKRIKERIARREGHLH